MKSSLVVGQASCLPKQSVSREYPTTVTVLTPPGRGAVATVCVDGPKAAEMVDACFVSASHQPIASRPVGRIAFGTWQGNDPLRDGPGEELVVCRTRDNRVEIHCHGGQAAVENVMTSLTSLGALARDAEVWAVQNESDPIVAAAHIALGEAKTERAALILLDQHQGALRQAVDSIVRHLDSADLDVSIDKIESLLQFANLGLHLIEPWKVAIIGPPNVGKSSLMNRLAGFDRSIVFDRPGTTRDLVTSATAFDGWPIELIDTAGLRDAYDEIEADGVIRAIAQMKQADLILHVVDAGNFENGVELDIPPTKQILVLNKCDLCPDSLAFNNKGVRISAMRGDGIEQLINTIVQRLVPLEPAKGDPVPFTLHQVQSLRLTREFLKRGDRKLAGMFARGFYIR